jgi:hypothetical protein
MDILKTGDSIGAEGLAVEEQGTFYPLADADRSTFDALYDGPLQAAFRLTFQHWDVGTAKRDGVEELTVDADSYLFRDLVDVSLDPKQKLVIGLPNFYPDIQAKFRRHNREISSVSTWGPQAEGTGSNLGLAIFFPSRLFDRVLSTSAKESAIPDSHLVVLHPDTQQVSFATAVCWERTDPRFSTREGFETFLQEVADKMANPISVTVHRPNQNGERLRSVKDVVPKSEANF